MKKTIRFIAALLFFPLAAGAQSLPKAEQAYAQGDFTQALAQYEQILQTATGEDRLQAQLRKAACQYGLGEYMNAAQTMLAYELPSDDLWKARFLLYRVQTAERVAQMYPSLMNESEVVSLTETSPEEWTAAQWNAQIDKDYQTLWALRASLINDPVEKETLILNIKDTDTRRIPTLFDVVVQRWTSRLQTQNAPIPLAREKETVYLEGTVQPVPAKQTQAAQLSDILETAYLLDGKGRKDAKTFWRTDYIMLPFDNPSLFTLNNPEKARKAAVEQLELISGYTPQKMGFWSKLKKYVAPDGAEYGRAYAAYRAALLMNQYDNPEQALNLCQYAGEKLGSSYYVSLCSQLARQITQNELSFHPLPDALNPTKPELTFSVRNAPDIYVRAYLTSYEELQTLYRKNYYSKTINSWDFLYQLNSKNIPLFLGRTPLQEVHTAVSYKKPYRGKDVSVRLPALEKGFYVLLASWDSSFDDTKAPVWGTVANLTDLAIFVTSGIEDNPDKYTASLSSKTRTYRPDVFRFYTVNLKTGEPEGNADLDIISAWNGTHQRGFTQQDGTSTLGRDIVVSAKDKSNSYFVNVLAKKNGDTAFTRNAVYARFYNRAPVRMYAQTDRAIYRPGQKVQLAVNAFETLPRGLKVLPNKRVQIEVTNASGEKVFSANPMLNEMGTAQAQFTLPEEAMLGYFQIRVLLNTNGRTFRTYGNFRVEDFKRPDYEITLADPEKALAYGKSASIPGHAQYYVGAPLQNATVKYTVSRQQYVPPFYWWRYLPPVPPQQVSQGETQTDENGNFHISFTPQTAEKDEEFAKYAVNAEVYDESGRAIQTSRTYTVSTQPKLFKVEFSQGFYDAQTETPHFAQIDLTNADGASVSGKVTARVERLENKLPPQPENNVNYNNSLDVLYQKARAEETIFTRELNFKKPGVQTLSLPALPEGIYRLHLQESKASPQQMIFVVAQPESALQLPAVTLVQRPQYYPGETARVLLGASALKGSKRVEVFWGDSFLTRKDLLPGGVNIYAFPVEQEFRGGLAVTWFGASDYTFHSSSADLVIPFDNKELGVTVDVPNTVRPGEEVSWKLSVKDASGAAVNGQASVTVYDKSLDYYAAKENPFGFSTLFPQQVQAGGRASSQGNTYAVTYANLPPQSYPQEPALPSLNLTMPRFFYGLTNARSMAKPQLKAAYAAGGAVLESAAAAMDSAAGTGSGLVFAEEETAAVPSAAPAERENASSDVRTDFSETAYFNAALPVVNGQAAVRFTLPQSVTAWNILGFVLTKNADFGAFEAQTVTRKDFMVRAQLPRFYREGDKGVLQAAVTNLTDKKLSAEVEITLTQDNAPANEAFGLGKTKKTLSVSANATEFVSWDITAPSDPALYTVTVTTRSGSTSDGEQKTLPVYPGKQRLLATAHKALANGQNELELTELKDVSDAELQTAALTLNPSLALSVLNTMPQVLSSPYNDLVSALNRYVPLAVVNQFYTSYPQLKDAVAKLPKRTGITPSWNESDPLRLTLLEQTPWLRQSQGQAARTADIVDLFNPQLVSKLKKKELAQIAKFQNKSGAFAWFPGGQDDDYLTLYALNAFAQALAYEAEIPQASAQKAFAYIVPRIEKRLKEDKSGSETAVAYALYAAYTLSAFPQNWAQMAEAKPYIKRWADYADQQSRFMTALGQTYAAAVYHRLGDDVKANRYLDLVLSRMKQNDLTGAYFAPEEQSWVWYRDTLSTQTVVLRTLLELRPQSDKIDPMTQWLLFNRQVNSWSDPKAAAQAVFTLLDVMKHKGALSLPVEYTVNWAGEEKKFSFEPMDWTEDLQLVRQGKEITPSAFRAKIEKKSVLTDFASLSVIYKSAEAKESPKGVLNVTREYFTRFTQDGVQKIRPVQDLGEVNVGDEVEVHLTVTADSAFEYVLLTDPKPAGFETDELLSGWTYDPLYLYRENRDAVTNFFISRLPAGTVTLRYVLRPTLGGRFHSLPAQAQSLYAPEYGAHSAAETLSVSR